MNENTISNYFEIKPKNGSLEFIVSDFKNGRYKFTVKYNSKYIPKYDLIKLPIEMNDIINSYLDDFIIIELISIHFNSLISHLMHHFYFYLNFDFNFG